MAEKISRSSHNFCFVLFFFFHCNIVFEIITLFIPQTLTQLVIEATVPYLLLLQHFTTCSLAASC